MLWANRYRKMDANLEDDTEVILESDMNYSIEGGKIDINPWEVLIVGDGDQAAIVERPQSELEECGWFDDKQNQRCRGHHPASVLSSSVESYLDTDFVLLMIHSHEADHRVFVIPTTQMWFQPLF